MAKSCSEWKNLENWSAFGKVRGYWQRYSGTFFSGHIIRSSDFITYLCSKIDKSEVYAWLYVPLLFSIFWLEYGIENADVEKLALLLWFFFQKIPAKSSGIPLRNCFLVTFDGWDFSFDIRWVCT